MANNWNVSYIWKQSITVSQTVQTRALSMHIQARTHARTHTHTHTYTHTQRHNALITGNSTRSATIAIINTCQHDMNETWPSAGEYILWFWPSVSWMRYKFDNSFDNSLISSWSNYEVDFFLFYWLANK